MLLSASATPACHPLLLDKSMPPATAPWLCVEALFPLAVMGTVSPMAGVGSAFWVLCEMFFLPVLWLSQGRASSLCVLGLMGIHTQCPVCDAQC